MSSYSRLDSQVVIAWSPKNKEWFQIVLVDYPRVAGVQLMNRRCVEP